MKAIGIDIGTTTISAVVYDAERKEVIESRTVQNGCAVRTAHPWERLQDAKAVVSRAAVLLDALCDRFSDINSIGLTGQMHGIVYINANGECISPLYTWQDARGGEREAGGCSACEQIYEKTGRTVPSGYGLVTHYFNWKNGLMPKECAGLCTIADYLGMYLTGRKMPLIHVSNAAGLGLFDCRKGAFQRDGIERLGMDAGLLPQVCRCLPVLGEYKGIPVTAALGDNQASFLGSVGARENTFLFNVGTGGQISVLSKQYFAIPGIETRPLTGEQYLLVGASLCGGRAYAALERFFRQYLSAAGFAEASQYGVMAGLAEKGKKAGSRMKVCTAFRGTRENPDMRGGISNLDEENFTPEGLVYGVLEGIAAELYGRYCLIREGTGIRAEHLVASGNGIRQNIVLQEICSEMFQADVEFAACEEEAACGAAVSSLPE